jgi:hypothetical protein
MYGITFNIPANKLTTTAVGIVPQQCLIQWCRAAKYLYSQIQYTNKVTTEELSNACECTYYLCLILFGEKAG